MANIDSLLRSLKKDLGASNYATFKLHAKQQEIYDCRDEKQIFLFCANRWGKTALGIALIKGLANGSYSPMGKAPKPTYNVCVHSQDNLLNLTIIIPKMKEMIPESWLDENILNAKSKTPAFSEIRGPKATVNVFFKSGEMDTGKLAGAEFDLVWSDEFVSEEHYGELKARTVSVDGVMLNTYTLVNGVDWTYDYSSNYKRFTGTMYDNPYLDKDVIDKYASELSEEEREIRVEGKALDLSGLRYLTGDPMQYVNDSVMKPVEIKRVIREGKTLSFDDDPMGDLFFFHGDFDEFDIFSIGCDIASGSGDDFSTIDVNLLHEDGMEEFCLYRSKTTDIPTLSKILYTLAKHFNMAVVNMDTTGLGISVLSELLLMKYPNIASRENPDAITTTDSLGFKFTALSRSALLSEYRKSLQKKQIIIRHAQTAGEISMYQYIGNRFDHITSTTSPFAHDDCLMASALAWWSIRFNTQLFTQAYEKRKEEEKKYRAPTFRELEKWEQEQTDGYEETIGNLIGDDYDD